MSTPADGTSGSSNEHGGTNNLEGGRALFRGRILGFPVHLDISFVIIMFILGWSSNVTLSWIVLWVLITPLAVLVHELGHAVAARAAGAHPEIALAGFGGVTTFTPPKELSRARSIGISVAGPFVGLAVGLVLLAVQRTAGADLEYLSWQWSALRIGIFTCIGWSLLNLLPVMPLDGGQAMREFLPGTPDVRYKRAAAVSVVAGVIVAILAYTVFEQPFVALFMLFFVVSNAMALREPAEPTHLEIGNHPGALPPERAVTALIWQGEPTRARELLSSLPADLQVDLVVHGAVLFLTGDREQGRALMDQEAARRPDDNNVAALMMLALGLGHDWDAAAALLQQPIGAIVPPAALDRVIEEARGTGREDIAGRLTVLAGR